MKTTKINDKDIRISDKKAVRLAKKRAVRENRSAANAAAVTIIEALRGTNSNGKGQRRQGKNDR